MAWLASTGGPSRLPWPDKQRDKQRVARISQLPVKSPASLMPDLESVTESSPPRELQSRGRPLEVAPGLLPADMPAHVRKTGGGHRGLVATSVVWNLFHAGKMRD
jgi:hypothetical protein